MTSTAKKPAAIEILLAEDNPADVRLTREALKLAKVLNILHHVEDGMEAMDFLLQKGNHVAARRPDLILLDLNMPKMGGREVLAAVKSNPRLQAIPVVVLTTSKAEEDIVQSYNLHANAYVSKPVDLLKFFAVVRSFEEFWLTVVTLPQKEN
jgi:CheY-like chemotaxis protein